MSKEMLINIEITGEEYYALLRATSSFKDAHYEKHLDSLWEKVRASKHSDIQGHKKCHTCMRPFKKLKSGERARSNVGTGHEKQVAKSLGDMGNACKKVHELLQFKNKEDYALTDGGWVSRDCLSRELNGGDGARRVRQLRDEFGIPIEVKMVKTPGKNRQAHYRIVEPNYFKAFYAFDKYMSEPTDSEV